MKKTVVIVGGGAGGMTTATQLKKQAPNVRVVVFEKSSFVSWAGCPTPYFISGKLNENSIVHNTSEYFINNRNIEVFVNHEVVGYNFEKKTITVKGENIEGEFSYDELVLSTGAPAFIPPMKGIESNKELPVGVFTLNHITDAFKIKNFVNEYKIENAIVIGAGFIGLEMAESFHDLGMNVTIVEKMPDILPFLTGRLQRKRILDSFKNNNVNIMTNRYVTEIYFNGNNISGVILDNGNQIPAQLILIAIGIRPDIKILENSGLKLDNGRLFVNDYLETNIKGVYALGNMIWTKNMITGKPAYSPLGDVTDKQGILLGNTLAGNSLKFNGVIGAFSTSLFGWQIAKTGLTLSEAIDAGYRAEEVEVRSFHRIPGFSNTQSGILRAVYDKDNLIILGATIVSTDAAAQFIDQFSIVITRKIPIEEFFEIDFAYSPTTSVVWNPLLAVYRKVFKR